MEQLYTISIFSENFIGLLNRVTIIFTRRHLNIASITASASEIEGIHRYTIVLRTTKEMVEKVVHQLEKLVEVIMAKYYTDDEIIYQEIALYKVPTSAFANGNSVEKLIRQNNARILRIEPEYVVLEKTGHKDETQQLFEQLQPYGIFQFARSGRVAISQDRIELSSYLKELEEES